MTEQGALTPVPFFTLLSPSSPGFGMISKMSNLVIFTDLDGTLLDASTYSFEAARDALRLIKERHIPLVLCSSKTRAEIEHYRSLLRNTDPFISENGGGIFIPPEYGPLKGSLDRADMEDHDSYFVVTLGASYGELRRALETLRAQGFDVRGFGDMTIEEVSHLTGLPIKEAALAREREFDEPFIFNGTPETLEALLQSISALGFNATKGRFLHLLGNSDKGKAVSILSDLYRKALGEVLTVGIGDSPNDIPMLEHADLSVAVQKEDGNYDPAIDVPNLVRVQGIGPKGWNQFVKTLVQTWQG
jgi:mannosyl-3-phosphoglycerate phosphatase family protein